MNYIFPFSVNYTKVHKSCNVWFASMLLSLYNKTDILLTNSNSNSLFEI